MHPSYNVTPLLLSKYLSEHLQKNIYIKYETLQPTGSFKDRGIGNFCNYLAKQGSDGFVCSSGGNAGMAVAYASKRLGLPAHIVVPTTTPDHMKAKLKATSANIIEHGSIWNEADELARQKVEELKLDYISPFNHPKIWEGYESIPAEIAQTIDKPDAIVLSVGGGGLYSGIVQGLRKVDWPDVPIITAETKGAASFATAFQQKSHITLDKIDTIAGTLGAKQVCEQAFKLSMEHPTSPQTVTDKQAANACIQFVQDHRILVEPACGASLSLLYDANTALKSYQNIVVILCGGNGISCELLAKWKQQFDI